MPETLERLLPLNLRENTEMYNKIQDVITSAKICYSKLLSMSGDQVKAANIPDPDSKQIPHVCAIPRVTGSNDELTSCKNVLHAWSRSCVTVQIARLEQELCDRTIREFNFHHLKFANSTSIT